MKQIGFFERRCFAIRSNDLLEFLKEQKDDDSLTFEMEEGANEIYLCSHKNGIEYNEDDIIDCVSRVLGVKINNLFMDGDKYCAILYFTERKLET